MFSSFLPQILVDVFLLQYETIWTKDYQCEYDYFQADLEVQFAPEVQEIGEAKAGPGDEAKISAKIRAFPDADVTWYKVTPAVEGEEGSERKTEKIDKSEDKKWDRYV